MKIVPPNIEIRETKDGRGLGVFTLARLDIGSVVETCPVVIINADYKRLSRDVQLKLFDWNDLTQRGPNFHALALGYGSIYNGDNPANLHYAPFLEGQRHYIVLSAVRAIEVGEELTVNYSGKKGSHISLDNRWFTENGIPFISNQSG